MAKRKQTDKEQIGKELAGPPPVIISILLINGKWKVFLTEYECKTIIAHALNYCVFHHKLVITGYLITSDKVYLVLYIPKEMFNRTLMIFYEKIKRSLRKHFVIMANKGVPFLPAPEVLGSEESYTNLFEEYDFDDAMLVALLTGKKPAMPDFDQQFEQLKLRLSGCDFCSVHQYGGAIGQVVLIDLINS